MRSSLAVLPKAGAGVCQEDLRISGAKADDAGDPREPIPRASTFGEALLSRNGTDEGENT